MEQKNESSFTGFILLGFSDRLQLEPVLFVVLLIFYIFTLLGNTTIIALSYLDPHLHTPMYFFLSNLSFLDMCYTTSIVPQFLFNLSGADKSISFGGCIVQMYISLALGGTECILLGIMAIDRYAAVCKPLHYTVIMHPRLCALMASASWITGFANSLLQTVYIFLIPLCGRNKLDHFLCEIPPFLKLGSVDTTMSVYVTFFGSVIILALIMFSYGRIVRVVLRIKSTLFLREIGLAHVDPTSWWSPCSLAQPSMYIVSPAAATPRIRTSSCLFSTLSLSPWPTPSYVH